MNNKKESPEKKAIKLDRSSVRIEVGEIVQCKQQLYKLTHILDDNELVGLNLKTSTPEKLLVKHIKHAKPENIASSDHLGKDISEITEKELREIDKRISWIQPILDGASTKEISEHARKEGVHLSTLYRCHNSYRTEGSLVGLLPKKRGPIEGRTTINLKAESIMTEVIDTFYLTNHKPTVKAAMEKVKSKCYNQGITPPSENTFRRRVQNISEYAHVKRREGRSAARGKFSPAANHFTVNHPLEYVQIDHTKVDLMLVDEENRLPTDRPTITLMIDIYSRMIHGYYLSYDPPSSDSVAMCIVNAVCDKEKTLLDLNIDGEWNMWGFMDNLHSDNGADFHSNALKNGCRIYDVHLEKRPLIKTEYGGHIERVLGTLMKETHKFPGTTFPNIQKKGKYNSEKEAVFTLRELERNLVNYIVNIYHKEEHRALGMSPEQKWKEYYSGMSERDGSGFQPKPSDPQTILLDFAPMVRRTIQRNGISIGGVTYYDSVLRSFIKTTDKKTKDNKKFIFKTDPRDISYVWFYDDKGNDYYKIPLMNQKFSGMTSGELKLVRDMARKKSQMSRASQEEMARQRDKIDKQTEKSIELTKKQRKENEQKHTGKAKKDLIMGSPTIPETPKDVISDEEWDNMKIPVFNIKKEQR